MRLLVAGLLAAVSFGQSFEAASVRASGKFDGAGNGIRRADPGQLTYGHATVRRLLMDAYALKEFQIAGPAWLDSERFDVIAKLPGGATDEQVKGMLQSLLLERFKLKLHRESKVFQVYELTIAKGGSKLKPSPDDAKILTDYSQLKVVDGIPQFPPGSIAAMGAANKKIAVLAGAHEPISMIVEFLSARLSLPGEVRPVVDKTGLTGYYDFGLRFIPPGALLSANPTGDASDPELDILAAVEKYLGLKLEAKKDPLDVLVIDSADKTPVEN